MTPVEGFLINAPVDVILPSEIIPAFEVSVIRHLPANVVVELLWTPRLNRLPQRLGQARVLQENRFTAIITRDNNKSSQGETTYYLTRRYYLLTFSSRLVENPFPTEQGTVLVQVHGRRRPRISGMTCVGSGSS